MDHPENSGRQTSDPHIHNLDVPRVTYRWLKTSSHPLPILLATSTMANNNPITIKVSSKTYIHHARQQEATFHAFVGYEVFVKLVPEVHYSICCRHGTETDILFLGNRNIWYTFITTRLSKRFSDPREEEDNAT
jgi:hypothetical protein